ncbi:hypothetical protein MKW94_021018, partial [Papaver nudicaule]|nr:hypothetical protein [Papaver nudicaule]
MDPLEEGLQLLLRYRQLSSQPNFEIFKAAYTGNLNNFKSLALSYAEKKGVGVGKAIGKLVDEEGKGCLLYAAEGNNVEVCKYLLETLKLDVHSKDGKGQTPLYYAIKEGDLITVRYLLEKGANVDASDDTGHTPLQCAAAMGDTTIIALLLSKGVHVDVATKGGTALLIAVSSDHQDVVKMLLDHGANPDVVACEGMLRPLISAIYAKSWECMDLLLQ